ncbi:MAG: substrate-binding domain-containing protein, partial [Anaerolineales bacterium]|nr:substrate-binding domain-containing protein [Anaerolineales bacterium]
YSARFPMVLLHRTPPPDVAVPSVSFENKDGAVKMVQHLLGCGHRRIAFLAGAPNNEDANWREAGYREALAAADIPFDPLLVREARFEEETAVSVVTALLKEKRPIDAIFAADDVSARGALRAAHAAGLCVPKDIAIVGFDDALLSQYTDPPLTTVKAPIEEAGRAAARQLLKLINTGQADPLTLLPTELVIRQSCGCQSAQGGDFIRVKKQHNGNSD